jgi:hypothetical protein
MKNKKKIWGNILLSVLVIITVIFLVTAAMNLGV